MRYFRKLLSFDADAFAAHLLRLDESDRASRFSAHTADERVRAYVAELDWRRTVVIGCFDGVELRGAAELHFAPPGAASREGEFAVTVEPRWRGAGLGTEFLRRTILLARNRMIARLRMVCLLDNGPMRRIASRFGAALDFADGQAWADIRLPYPDPLSLASEAWTDGLGYAAAMHARRAAA